ncbi:MAG TPA: roadblock/LC7 domain-containing protein [Verrucomicrobiae bacterium]|jgi:predicted regulator of Ras-like GTPase activity (Roadblock/LC7/MglB family)
MFGLLKKMFSHSAAPAPAPAPAAKPAHSPAPPARASAGSSALVAAAAAPASGPPAVVSKLAPRQSNGMIELPLCEILSRLPDNLTAQVKTRPDVMFSLSTSVAVEQLRCGAVRIPFMELRRGSPPGTFHDLPADDNALVDLPLPLILGAIGPSGLLRRQDQQRVIVPDEVTGVFGGKLNQFVRVTEAPAAASAHSPKPAAPPAPVAPIAPVSLAAPITLIAPVAPITPISPIAPKPAAPIPFMPVAPAPATGLAPKPALPFVMPPAAPKPAAPVVPGLVTPKVAAPIPLPAAAPKTSAPLPFATARPSPAPGVVLPFPNGDKLDMPLDALCAAWPDPIRQEIELFKLAGGTLSIPMHRLETGLKAGRVTFTWADLGAWMNPPAPPSAHGETPVELPLKVAAPLFLAKHRGTVARKVVSAEESVPDVFAGANRASAAPAPMVMPAPVEAPAAPVKKDLTPQEFTRRILSLPGVAGSLLASGDGLLVAGQMPAPLKAEALAAFVPGMFTRIGACAEEVQLGNLGALRISTGAAACVIRKAGSLYLAVLGRAGQALPEAALEQMAAELSEQNH